MGGSKLGGLRAKETNLLNNPNFYKELGRIGGSTKTKNPKGFAARPEVASRAGKIGGAKSRPPKPKSQEEVSGELH